MRVLLTNALPNMSAVFGSVTSVAARYRVLMMCCSPGDTLWQVKLGILNFTAACQIAPAECILPYLVAAADPLDPVAQRGEELLKKRYLPYWITWPHTHHLPCLHADQFSCNSTQMAHSAREAAHVCLRLQRAGEAKAAAHQPMDI